MGRLDIPDFALEVYFSKWEFSARHNLAASDAESTSVKDLLGLEGDSATRALLELDLGYIPTWGTEALRNAIAATYDRVGSGDVLAFAGAGEALFWGMQLLLEPGDHAIVTVPNYQSIESLPVATGVKVDGLPLWTGSGASLNWVLDLDRFRKLLRADTRLVAVNFPNNPTGFVPDEETWKALLALCAERDIRVLSDEVYRGVETDPARTLAQAADHSPSAVSVNVMSKAYGLPGLRVGWIACRDAEVLRKLERAKHYTSICNAGPSEFLATIALRHREQILARNRRTIETNVAHVATFAQEHSDRFQFTPPDGGCVAFPRYLGAEGAETFCRRAVEQGGVLLLPSSVYASTLADVPADRFRIGVGRKSVPAALDQLRRHLSRR